LPLSESHFIESLQYQGILSVSQPSNASAAEHLGVLDIQARASALFELGLLPGADDDSIRAAFRSKLKGAHPDLNGGTDANLRRIILARDLLMSENRRSAEKAQWLKDFATSNYDSDGALLLNISIRQAIHGGETEQAMPALEVTPAHEQLTSLTQMKTLRIFLPAGLRDGEKLRLKIEGAARPEQLFRVHIVTENGMSVSGNDISMPATVEARIYFNGGQTVIQTPHGPREVEIGRAVETGAQLSLAGLGLPATDVHPCGDLHVRLEASANVVRAWSEARAEFGKKWAS
jgi:curved DNA-binding protein